MFTRYLEARQGKATGAIKCNSAHRAGGFRSLAQVGLFLALLAAAGGVSAQTAEAPLPLTAPAGGTREELLELLESVDEQLRAATAGGQQQDVDRLLELKSQFEVLILQAELEDLRRENTQLKEQSGAQGSQVGGGADSAMDMQMTGMAEQFTELDEQQANVVSQLEKIADQHAILLDQLGNAPAESAAPAPVPNETRNAQLQRELGELQERFSQLSAQQGTVNTELQTITDDHAAIIGQLSNAAPTAPRTHTVVSGDSLSDLAKAYYGSGNRWPELLAANAFVTEPNRLFVGTVLTIP